MTATGGQCAEGADVVEVGRAGFPATGVAGQVVAAADRAECPAVVLHMPERYLRIASVLGQGPAWSDLVTEFDGLCHRTVTRAGRSGLGLMDRGNRRDVWLRVGTAALESGSVRVAES